MTETGPCSPDLDTDMVQSPASLDVLQEEVVRRVMNFLSIADVHRLMRVNQKWERAARDDIRTRESLEVCRKPVNPGTGSSLDVVVCRDQIHFESMLTCLLGKAGDDKKKGMMKLKRLVYHPEDNEIAPLILKNRMTLESLEIKGTGLPSQQNGTTEYPQLRTLTCLNADMNAVSFPQLTSLTIVYDEKIPVQALLSATRLETLWFRAICASEQMASDLVRAVAGMTRLKVLELKLCILTPGKPFLSLFGSLTRLEDVSLEMLNGPVLDPAVAALVRMNPNLKRLELTCMRLTDDSLQSLSQLNHLSSVTLVPGARTGFNSFTIAGVLTLLRGGSRHQFRQFEVNFPGRRQAAIAEIRKIMKETNCSFKFSSEMGVKFEVQK